MEVKLALRGGRRSPGTDAVSCLLAAAVLLFLLLTGAAASPSTTAANDGNAMPAASRRGSSSWWLWRQGNRGFAAPRRLLLAVGKDTNEFHVEGVRRPADGKLAREVGFNEGRRIPGSGSNRNHN